MHNMYLDVISDNWLNDWLTVKSYTSSMYHDQARE